MNHTKPLSQAEVAGPQPASCKLDPKSSLLMSVLVASAMKAGILPGNPLDLFTATC